jgi:hypothetical protein
MKLCDCQREDILQVLEINLCEINKYLPRTDKQFHNLQISYSKILLMFQKNSNLKFETKLYK